MKKNPNSSRVANLQERISSVGSTLKTMNTLESSSQMYSLKSSNTSVGGLTLNGSTIEINYNGTSNFVHEVTHAGQFARGDVGFLKMEVGLLHRMSSTKFLPSKRNTTTNRVQ